MLAVKENKVYKITETEKERYLSQGFNITDDKGNVIEHSPLSKVPYSEYAKVVKELEALKGTAKAKKSDKE